MFHLNTYRTKAHDSHHQFHEHTRNMIHINTAQAKIKYKPTMMPELFVRHNREDMTLKMAGMGLKPIEPV